MTTATPSKVATSSNRGSKPGERRGGRQAGTPNKATAEIKSLARVHGAEAMELLWLLARTAESEATQVAAIKELFDRGYGKATQLMGGDPEAGPIAITEIVRTIVRPK